MSYSGLWDGQYMYSSNPEDSMAYELNPSFLLRLKAEHEKMQIALGVNEQTRLENWNRVCNFAYGVGDGNLEDVARTYADLREATRSNSSLSEADPIDNLELLEPLSL